MLIGIFQPPAGKYQYHHYGQQEISRKPSDGFDEHQIFQLSAADIGPVGADLHTQVPQQQRIQYPDHAVSQIK